MVGWLGTCLLATSPRCHMLQWLACFALQALYAYDPMAINKFHPEERFRGILEPDVESTVWECKSTSFVDFLLHWLYCTVLS